MNDPINIADTEEQSKQQLIARLEGLARSLRLGLIPLKGIYGNLLLELETAGYLKLQEKHYILIASN